MFIVNVTDIFAISHTGVSVKFTMKLLECQGTPRLQGNLNPQPLGL